MIDLIRLSKLLELSQSPFDGEALNCIRIANAELMKENKTWTELLMSKNNGETKKIPSPDPVFEKHEHIKRMLHACLNLVRSESGLSFIRSLDLQYTMTGHLTEKQINALQNWYEKL